MRADSTRVHPSHSTCRAVSEGPESSREQHVDQDGWWLCSATYRYLPHLHFSGRHYYHTSAQTLGGWWHATVLHLKAWRDSWPSKAMKGWQNWWDCVHWWLGSGWLYFGPHTGGWDGSVSWVWGCPSEDEWKEGAEHTEQGQEQTHHTVITQLPTWLQALVVTALLTHTGFRWMGRWNQLTWKSTGEYKHTHDGCTQLYKVLLCILVSFKPAWAACLFRSLPSTKTHRYA